MTTALVLLTVGLLLVLAALATRLSGRFGLPSLLFFLLLGLLVHLQPFVEVPRPPPTLAFRMGAASLVLILFDGGLNTPLHAARTVLAPAAALATIGVVITAVIVGGAATLLGWPLPLALLGGAVVSSTDAAAVFNALRASGSRLRERVGLTLELESGLNDPMAVFLTVTLTEALAGGHPLGLHTLLLLALELGVGTLVGVGAGFGGRLLLARAHLTAAGLYVVLTVAVAFSAFGLATLLEGSGFLAVYVAAIILGAGRLPYRASTLRVHDALAWMAQISMFLVLGLAIEPRELTGELLPGAALALVLAFVARPLAAFLCLLPFRYPWRENLFISFTGLRGAVPIVLATFPLIVGLAGAYALFNLVFVMVVAGSIVPGTMVGWLARVLKLRQPRPPPPPAGLEMVSHADYDGEFVSYYVSHASAAVDAKVKDLPLPDGCLVTLVVRGHELLAPRGETEIRDGDHVYVFTKSSDRPLLDLLFGYLEE